MKACFGLFCFLLAAASLRAEPAFDPLKLLLHPEAIFQANAAAMSNVALAPEVDGKVLSVAAPRILFQQSNAHADFVAAAWDDAASKVIHQREVLFVKPDYVVVVDQVYGNGPHTVVRQMQASDSVTVKGIDTSKEATAKQMIVLTSQVNLPAPFATILTNRGASGGLKIEMIKAHNPMIVKYKVTFPHGRTDEGGVAWESRALHLGSPEIPLAGWAAWVEKQSGQVTTFEIK